MWLTVFIWELGILAGVLAVLLMVRIARKREPWAIVLAIVACCSMALLWPLIEVASNA